VAKERAAILPVEADKGVDKSNNDLREREKISGGDGL
jgi:hypothetical protein